MNNGGENIIKTHWDMSKFMENKIWPENWITNTDTSWHK